MKRGALNEVSTSTLENLLGAVERDELGCPMTLVGLQARMTGPVHDVFKALRDLNADAAIAVLNAALAERRAMGAPRLELVWSGPEAVHSVARDTSVLLRELFDCAQTSLLIAGYAFDRTPQVLAPLTRTIEERGVAVRMFLDVRSDWSVAEAPEERVARYFKAFLRDAWPRGCRAPEIYYDRRALDRNSHAGIHAKCVVADEMRTLVTSANFTNRGQERNVEVGVLVDDAAFARSVVGQFEGLVRDRHAILFSH